MLSSRPSRSRLGVRVAVVTVLTGALLAGVAPVPGAWALQGQRERSIPVWEGVDRQEWRLTTSDGRRVEAQIVVIDPDADIDLDLALAHDQVPGLETVPSMARRRTGDGAVLGINGGFWRSFPLGRPDGFTVYDSRLISEGETRGEPDVGRGAFGLAAEGPMVDRILPQDVELDGPEQPSMEATGINRLGREGTARVPEDGNDALYVITDQFASSVTLPADDDDPRGPASWRAVADLTTVPRGHGEAGDVGGGGEASPGATLSIPSRGALLIGYGASRSLVEDLGDGALAAETSLEIDNPEPGRGSGRWAESEIGITGGPHIVRNGGRAGVSPSNWRGEGFGDAHHARQPRTAVGHLADGTLLLVTVDGRRDDSAGLGTAEMQELFIQLGAEEAVMLDGGGSSTMTQDTVTVNTPSDGQPRPVANALFVNHQQTLTATERLAGAGREATAARAARAGFPDGAQHAVVAAAGDFPDALAGGPLAATLDAPLLLANPGGVADVTRDALRDLGVQQVTILGGTAAVPDEAADRLRSDGYDVRRLAGATRFDTAAAIAGQVSESGGRVFLASGQGFADALVAAAPAGMLDAPILLAARDQLTDATRRALAAREPEEIVLVGGTGVLDDDVARAAQDAVPSATVRRISGRDRFGTARALNDWAASEIDDLDTTGVVVARGDAFPDALAGGPLAAARRQLLMTVPVWDIEASGDARAYLQARSDQGLEQVTLLGGFAVLTSYQQLQLDRLAR